MKEITTVFEFLGYKVTLYKELGKRFLKLEIEDWMAEELSEFVQEGRPDYGVFELFFGETRSLSNNSCYRYVQKKIVTKPYSTVREWEFFKDKDCIIDEDNSDLYVLNSLAPLHYKLRTRKEAVFIHHNDMFKQLNLKTYF